MKTVYIHGILLDGSENMEPQTGMAVITEGEKIIAVEPSSPLMKARRSSI